MYRVSDMKAAVVAVLVYNNRLHNECVSTNQRHKCYFYVLPMPYLCNYNHSHRYKIQVQKPLRCMQSLLRDLRHFVNSS